jgi:ABC-type phosphate transport system substrate-binding protein
MGRLATALLVLSLAGLLLAGVPSQAPPPTGPAPAQQTPGPEPLAIVVNKANPMDDLSMAELRRVFLGERGHWPNGRRITLVMLDPGWQERDEVLSNIYHMDETQFKNHFLRGLFTGEVLVSPKTLSTPEGVRKFVFNVPGAIGYLRASDVDKTIKVIRIDERLPDDKGYKLHVPSRESK